MMAMKCPSMRMTLSHIIHQVANLWEKVPMKRKKCIVQFRLDLFVFFFSVFFLCS